jgi:hypothetical protein
MTIQKKRNESTQSHLLLEAEEPVELPPAQIEESALIVQFEKDKPHVPELLDTLRAGTRAELVPVMRDGSTFAIHTATRTFWVKLWHTSDDLTHINRAQVISCLPSTRGLRFVAPLDDEDEYYDDDDFGEADDAEDDR